MPGLPGCGGPLAPEATNRFSPRASSPAGLMKSVSWILPTWLTWATPGRLAETVPSRAMLTESAFCGMLIGGYSW